MRRIALAGLLVAFLALPAQAAINGNHPYAATLPYQAGLNPPPGSPFTLLSGALEADLAQVRGPYGLFHVDTARVSGLTRVCFGTQCHTSVAGQLSVAVSDGGSFGLRFPKASSAKVSAEHALGILADFGGKRDLNSLSLGKSLIVPAIGGSITFTQLPNIPATTQVPDATGPQADAGGMVALDGDTTLRILDGTVVKATIPAGKQDPLAFQGQPRVEPLHPDLMVLPFEAGNTFRLSPAQPEAAAAGLSLERVERLGGQLSEAARTGTAEAGPSLSFGPLQPLLAQVLNGAVFQFSATQGNVSASNVVRQLTLVRIGTLDASSDGQKVAVAGPSSLHVQNGEVVKAQSLVGFAVFQMPWWSYALWVAALGLFMTRLVTKPPKNHPVYDRYRWVGWVATGVLFLLFLWLWDREVHAVWGASLLSGGVSGEALLLLAAIELAPMFAVLFAVVAPVRVILRNGAMLLGHGHLMGLPAAFAYPFGYIFGAPLLLAYLNVGLKAMAGT